MFGYNETKQFPRYDTKYALMRIQENPIVVTYIKNFPEVIKMIIPPYGSSSQVIKVIFNNVFDGMEHI